MILMKKSELKTPNFQENFKKLIYIYILFSLEN